MTSVVSDVALPLDCGSSGARWCGNHLAAPCDRPMKTLLKPSQCVCIPRWCCFGGAPMRPKPFLSIPTLCVVLALSAATPAFAEIRILSSPGGDVRGFLKLFEVLRESGERIVIDGPCYSACTLVLSTIPRERICV